MDGGVTDDERVTDPMPEAEQGAEEPGSLVEEDLLVEDVSIDGMCGVY